MGPCVSGPTAPSAGYPKYNILMIMVDQMRSPTFWLPPAGGQGAINSCIQNIVGLQNQSYDFQNYYVSASPCTPSRAAILTGLYSQQTCMFLNEGTSGAPALQPYTGSSGYPTIANVLSQALLGRAYDCTWIGKWHLSCFTKQDNNTVGVDGPSDYGFTDLYSLPTTSTLYGKSYSSSPNGDDNEGNGGDFLDSQPNNRSVPIFPPPPPVPGIAPESGILQLNDAAIADAFIRYWIPHAIAAPPNGLGGGAKT